MAENSSDLAKINENDESPPPPVELDEVEEGRYTKEDLDNLRQIIFNDGTMLDKIVKKFDFADTQNLLLTNKLFNGIVIGNTSLWNKRRVVITMQNAKQIAAVLPKRPWTSAKLGLVPRKEFQTLQFIWKALEDLIAVNESTNKLATQLFSGYLMRDVLIHSTKLTRLAVSANLLCGTSLQDLRNLENITWNKLTQFEILFYEHIPDEEVSRVYASFGNGERQMARACLEVLSSFDWTNLDIFKMETVLDITLTILTPNFLHNVRCFDLNCFAEECYEAELWEVMKDIDMPHMTDFTVRVDSNDEDVHRNLRAYLDRQVQLTSVRLRVRALKTELFQLNNSRTSPYPLKHLHVEFRRVDYDTVFTFKWLSKLVQLKTFSLQGVDEYHTFWPPLPSARAILDFLPPTVTHVNLRICSGFDCRGQTPEMVAEDLERRYRVLLPNLKHFEYDITIVPKCGICTTRNCIEVGEDVEDIGELIRIHQALLTLTGKKIVNVEQLRSTWTRLFEQNEFRMNF